MQLDPQILAQLEKLKGENGDYNDLMKHLLKIRDERVEEQKPESVKTDSRYIPAKIVNFVLLRTNGQCAFPSCNKPYAILHHTQRWALKHIHDPDQIQPLCKAHERIAHHGLINCEHEQAENWQVQENADMHSDSGKAKFAIDKIVQRFRYTRA